MKKLILSGRDFSPKGQYEEEIEPRMREIVDTRLRIAIKADLILRLDSLPGRAMRPRSADSFKNVSTPRLQTNSKESARLCAFGHGFIVADRYFIPERTVAENGPCLISSLNQKLPPLRGNPQDAIDEAIEVGIIEQCDPISSADGA